MFIPILKVTSLNANYYKILKYKKIKKMCCHIAEDLTKKHNFHLLVKKTAQIIVTQ
jgi:hypothetical protein